MRFMDEYALNSGQEVNKTQGNMTFKGSWGYMWGIFHSPILGFLFFKGIQKSEFVLPIANKVKSKMSTWKSLQLSQARRLQLIELVDHPESIDLQLLGVCVA